MVHIVWQKQFVFPLWQRRGIVWVIAWLEMQSGCTYRARNSTHMRKSTYIRTRYTMNYISTNFSNLVQGLCTLDRHHVLFYEQEPNQTATWCVRTTVTRASTRQGVFCIPSRGCCSRLLYEGRKTLEARGKFSSLRKFFRTKWESSSNPSGKVLQTQVGIFFREST